MKQIDLKKYILDSNSKLFEALRIINNDEKFKIALIVDKKKKLIGTIVDGDIRRALLKKKSLDSRVKESMNKRPIMLKKNQNIKSIEKKIDVDLIALPVVDDLGNVKDLKIYDKHYGIKKNNIIFILAGGEGKRLRPLTLLKPKPLLKIGKRSLIENLILNLKKQGFENFFISLNYKGNIIKNTLNKIDFGINLNFIEEKIKLGTAGSLKLVKKLNDEPIIVINSDLMTDVSINEMIKQHKENKTDLTVAVTTFKLDIPYGVINVKNNSIKSITEKPSESYLINAGIYILEPSLIEYIKPNREFNMTDLLSILIKKKKKISPFHLYENWIDVGRLSDLKKAKKMGINL